MEAPPPSQLLTPQPQNYSIRRYNHHNHRGQGGGPVEMTKESSHSDNNDSNITDERCDGGQMRGAALDCNLASLCDHIQLEGFSNGVFSDVVLNAMGSTYHLHRLILSRSSYFRNMLQGPWKEANAPILTLLVDDKNVNGEAVTTALAYLYGHHPKLDDNNAFRVLAAASFLDLQDLCAFCTDFIIAELWSSNFLAYQVFAESQDYGIHGERVRNACWGYLCQSGAQELKEVLPKLSSQTLHALLTSDELWVPSEEKRFELARYSLLAKSTFCKVEHHEQGTSSCEVLTSTQSDSSRANRKQLLDERVTNMLESERGSVKLTDEVEGHNTAHNILVELADSIVDSHSDISNSKQKVPTPCIQSNLESKYHCNVERPSASNTLYADDISASCSYLNMHNGVGMSGSAGLAMEGPSDEDACYQLNGNWPPGDQMQCIPMNPSCNVLMPSEWERCNMSPMTWGGRIVGKREVKTCLKRHCGMSREDYDSFVNIFEGGSVLYCNMSFVALLNVRKHLEEMGFPCKAVNDGLWLQMLLSHQVQEIGADTCKNCCLMSMACACRQQFGYSCGVTATGYNMQDHDHSLSNDIGHVYVTSSAQGERNGLFRPVRVHVRGHIDGLAGIGRGTTFVPASAWPPTRYVFSRVPFGMGNRQKLPANDDPENRADNNRDLAGDGLTALVGLSQGSNDITNVHEVPMGREYETGLQSRMTGTPGPSVGGVPVQIMDSPEHAMGIEWENTNSSISLDLKTPLSHFPPFRFGVEFHEVHRLNDGQVKNSPEVFYAGSLWKVSIQAFSDEDPQGRRTLGLFLHRRKAEITDPFGKVHTYVDSREKVTARYQLICPSKREIKVFGTCKQTGTLLPKAPKGWGWRTALLFDELGDLLQNGALRIAAAVQLI